MKIEIACGCIPYRKNKTGDKEVLMILRTGGYWEFPKGKKEEGETDEETALREMQEETNLIGNIDSEKMFEEHYFFSRNKERISKTVRFFLCEVSVNDKVKIQKKEVTDFAWLTLNELEDRATYPEMKSIARAIKWG